MKLSKLLLPGLFVALLLTMLIVVFGCAKAIPTPPAPAPPAAPATAAPKAAATSAQPSAVPQTAAPKPSTSAVAPATSAPAPASPKATASAAPLKVRWSSLPIDFSGYAYSLGEANILNRKTNLQCTVESTAGSNAALDALTSELAQISGPIGMNTILNSYRGIEPWKGKPHKNLRLLVGGGGMFTSYITTTKSGIKTIQDLKGKTVPYYTRSRGNYTPWDAILQVYGFDPRKDFKEISKGDDIDAKDDLVMGRVDAMLSSCATSSLLSLQESIGQIVFIPVTPEKVVEAQKKFPDLMLASQPGNLSSDFLVGVKMAAPVPAVVLPRFTITHKGVSDEIAYTIVKTLVENFKELQKTIPDFTVETAAFVPQVPFHPGAIKALKELKLWTDDMEKAQQALLKAE